MPTGESGSLIIKPPHYARPAARVLAALRAAPPTSERVGLPLIPPGEPWRNGYIESFNGWLRDECLNINSFWSLAHAHVTISDWKTEYNYHRRHSAPGSIR
jgi:transposase InsO family protein